MNKYCSFLLFVLLFSCGKKANVETDIVKAHILNVENISDTTNISQFLNGVPHELSYGSISISDSRLLRFYNIPFGSLKIDIEDGRVTRLALQLFKESEKKDVKAITDILNKKMGEPESDDGTLRWKNDDVSFILELVDEKYSNNSQLLIRFGSSSSFYY